MATKFVTSLFGVPSNDEAPEDLRRLHRVVLTQMTKFEDEMERLAMPLDAIAKYREAVAIAIDDYRRRYRAESPPANLTDPADMPPPLRSKALSKYLGR